jgi:hypothetical protein
MKASNKMPDNKRTDNYSNIESVPIRTRIALWFIIVAIKICEPWQYAHQFEKDIDELKKLLRGDKQ